MLLLIALLILLVIGYLLWRRAQRASGMNKAQMISVQLLIVDAEGLKGDLQAMAAAGDPDSPAGLTEILGRAAMIALRAQNRWRYEHIELDTGTAQTMDIACGDVATAARSAFDIQTTANYTGDGDGETHQQLDADHPEGGTFLALTVAAAVAGRYHQPSGVREVLLALTALSAEDLIRAEVVWSPDQAGELLTEDDAMMLYPALQPLPVRSPAASRGSGHPTGASA